MNIKYFSIGILTLLLINSCTPDRIDRAIYNSEECLPQASVNQSAQYCDTSFISNYFCNIIDLGNFDLSIKARSFLPQFCLSVGQNVVYINDKNERQSFNLLNKDFTKSNSISTVFIHCENDSINYNGHCLSGERLSYQLQSQDNFTRFLIDISVKPDVSTLDTGLIGEILTIARDDSTRVVHEFEMVVNKLTLTEKYCERFAEEFFTSIEFFGETFTNVYSNSIPYQGAYKYYYNSQYGLIAFIDDADKIWRLL